MWRWVYIGISLLGMLLNVLIFCVIKFNDLKHLAISVSKIEKDVVETKDKVTSLEKAQTAMQAVCNERHNK